MRTSIFLLAVVASVASTQNYTQTTSANSTTTIVSVLTTICGAATVLTQNGNAYTCTKGVTLTIEDCPCTLTKAIPPPVTLSPVPPPASASTKTITVSSNCPIIIPPPLSPSLIVSPAAALSGTKPATGTGALPGSATGLRPVFTGTASRFGGGVWLASTLFVVAGLGAVLL